MSVPFTLPEGRFGPQPFVAGTGQNISSVVSVGSNQTLPGDRHEMNTTRFQQRLAFASLLFLVAVLATAALGQAPASNSQQSLPLSGDEVVRRMIERNLQRANALHGFQGTRVYHLRYQASLSAGSRNGHVDLLSGARYQAI